MTRGGVWVGLFVLRETAWARDPQAIDYPFFSYTSYWLDVSFYSCRILYSVFRNHPYYLKACELVDAIPASVGAPSVSALVDVMKATFALHTSGAYSINGVHPDHRFLLPVAPAIHRLALQT